MVKRHLDAQNSIDTIYLIILLDITINYPNKDIKVRFSLSQLL